MSRGQDFSKLGFDHYETDLVGCDRVKKMSIKKVSIFCMEMISFFVELVSVICTYIFMSVCTSSQCKLFFLGISV